MEVNGSNFSPNYVITKDVKRFFYYCYVRFATLIVLVGENALAKYRRNNVLKIQIWAFLVA